MRQSRSAKPGRWLTPLALALLLQACSGQSENAQGNQSVREERSRDATPLRVDPGLPGTPMAQRVAQIGLLNKRNGITRTLTMKPGEALRVGNAIVRLRACETAAPWENEPETGAFVQLDVLETRDNKWHRKFSGWLFKEHPDRNVVQHPIYDVWVSSCAMSWPEFGPETTRVAERSGKGRSGDSPASNASSAENSPAPADAPSPSATPSNPE